jgi:hypothetical protein
MKPKKLDGNGDVPQFELNKRLTHAKTQVANEQAHMIPDPREDGANAVGQGAGRFDR